MGAEQSSKSWSHGLVSVCLVIILLEKLLTLIGQYHDLMQLKTRLRTVRLNYFFKYSKL